MITRDCTVPAPNAGAGTERERLAPGYAMRLLGQIELWFERVRGRRDLMRLSDRALSDIGFNRADAEQEAGKPFWRP